QQDQVGLKLARGGDGHRARIFRSHIIATRCLEVSLEHAGQSRFVVNHQNFLFCHNQPLFGMGNMMVATAPRIPFRLAMLMVARCSSMIFRDTDSPSPVPVPTGFVVKKGSKSLSSLSSGMPLPVSSTTITILSP